MSTDLQICHLRLVLVWWSVVGIFGWQSVFEEGEIVREEDVVHNAAQIYNSVERNGLLSALYFRRACTDTASSAWTNDCLNYLQLDQDVQGGFFKCSSRFSAPKVPNALHPTRATFSVNFQWKKAPRWLSKFFSFHFGTENDQYEDIIGLVWTMDMCESKDTFRYLLKMR